MAWEAGSLLVRCGEAAATSGVVADSGVSRRDDWAASLEDESEIYR